MLLSYNYWLEPWVFVQYEDSSSQANMHLDFSTPLPTDRLICFPSADRVQFLAQV